MEGDLGGFEGTEPAKLVMFLELPVGKEEFLRIADPVKQALATTAKVASPDKVCRVLLRAVGLGCTQEPLVWGALKKSLCLGCTPAEALQRQCRGSANAVRMQRQCECNRGEPTKAMSPVYLCGGVVTVATLAACCLSRCARCSRCAACLRARVRVCT